MFQQPRIQPAQNRNCRGRVSVGAILAVCVVTLFIALGLVGYAWHKTSSKNARLEEEQRQVQQKQRQAEIEEQKRELERKQAEEAAKVTDAKNKQEAFAFRAKSLTNSLESLLVQIPTLQGQLERLRSGEEGKKVSLFPDLVVSARSLLNNEARGIPTRDDAVQKLEAIRRILVQLAENLSTTFEPTAQMTATLDDTKVWVDTAIGRMQTVKGVADSLLREAQIKVAPEGAPAQPPTLQAAMDTLTTEERAERQAIANKKINEAEKKVTETMADAKTNQMINTAQIEADRLKKEQEAARKLHELEMAKKEAEIKAAKLRAEAQTAEVKTALRSFISPGRWEVTPGFSFKLSSDTTPRPMSLSALQKAGCLEDSQKGIEKLWFAAACNHDKMRPRWPLLRNPEKAFQDEAKLKQVKTAQDYLIRLGPFLVELGLLQP